MGSRNLFTVLSSKTPHPEDTNISPEDGRPQTSYNPIKRGEGAWQSGRMRWS
jgi:hypothetical protein